ncbi:hypothetical protein Clacol_004729 [Clathrus columnatus]|uniref:Inhibitor of apoptosis repeat-containing protein n=1 Tax=Clathrus columnatus TaxID=1419009 RepID=A0AAV5AAJ6_9AGAM|nr:hypothetical protein Clacol_004729 [Clathrus columnatus]
MRSNGNTNPANNFVSFTERLKSFSKRSPKWPHSNSFAANPNSLAAAGFYFNPSDDNKDAVSCFICQKGLADWDPSDDPAAIHSNKYTFSPTRLPSSSVMEKARLETFAPGGKSWWPHDARNKGPSSKLMAQAGFIFTPASSSKKDDTCSCIYCGIELGGWQLDDDPMLTLFHCYFKPVVLLMLLTREEHRRRQEKNGTCPFFTIQDVPAKPQQTVNATNTLSRRNTASRSKSKHKPTPSIDETLQPEPETEPSVDNPLSKKRSLKSKSRETQPTVEMEDTVISPPPPKKKVTGAKAKVKSKAKSESRSKPLPLKNTSVDIPISSNPDPDPVPQLDPEVDIEPEPELEVEVEYEPEKPGPELGQELGIKQELEVEHEPEVEQEQVERKAGDNEILETIIELRPISESLPPTVSHLSISVPAAQTLTEAERAMTVEQWIRAEMERQYELLKTHGRSRIEAFKLQASETAKRIEQL